jgi:L-Ala-D/L-Glu epimerase / N-acetyl-D-glutamate racemase
MTARVRQIDVLLVELPFRLSFGHALATRRVSSNVIVRVQLDSGTVGFGEGVPREYVTGETAEASFSALVGRLAPALVGCAFSRPEELDDALSDAVDAACPSTLFGLNAARCALELAVLDALAKAAGVPVRQLVSTEAGGGELCYDAVLPFLPPPALVAAAVAIRTLGISRVKLKVGRQRGRDLRDLALIRRVLGARADIRVDANAAWTGDEAIAMLAAMRRYGVSAVEQPVAAGDLDGLRRVTATSPEVVIVDESLRTRAEAEELAGQQACGAFNIRVSKCGGLIPSLRIHRVAREHGVMSIVGAQVGETAILSAAGRQLAAIVRPRYLEGSAGSILLRTDIARERTLPRRGGRARASEAPGLGVAGDEARLGRLVRRSETVMAKAVGAR